MKGRSIWLPVLLALCTMVQSSCNNAENAENKTVNEENKDKFDSTDIKRDVNFVVDAISGGIMEVELGNLAKTNGMLVSVTEFGATMVSDHTAANSELTSLAQTKNITVPTTPKSEMQKIIDDLRQKNGSDFDKAYIDMMVSDHKDMIDMYRKESDKGEDADVKEWAGNKVPALQHHLEMAESYQKSMEKK